MNELKKQRTTEVIESLIAELLTEAPPMYATTINLLLPQFRLLLKNVSDEKLDYFIALVKKRIEYIEFGYEPIEE